MRGCGKLGAEETIISNIEYLAEVQEAHIESSPSSMSWVIVFRALTRLVRNERPLNKPC